jgi:hypothetical protein
MQDRNLRIVKRQAGMTVGACEACGKNLILRVQMVECLVCGVRLAYHTRIFLARKAILTRTSS